MEKNMPLAFSVIKKLKTFPPVLDNKGFSLVEALVALTIVLIVMLSYLLFCANSRELFKNSNRRLFLLQAVQNKINQLQSEPFTSPELINGQHFSTEEQEITLQWTVTQLSPLLKEIVIVGKYKQLQLKFSIKKSALIGRKDEQRIYIA